MHQATFSKSLDRLKFRPLCHWVLTLAVLTACAPRAAADDVLLVLPKNFDVSAECGWTRTKSKGYEELDFIEKNKTIFQFRGNKVTAGVAHTFRFPTADGGVGISKYDTKFAATYDKGHLSGICEYHSNYRNEGCKDRNDAESLRQSYKGTLTGEANTEGILKITVQITEDTILDREFTDQPTGAGKNARTTRRIFSGGWKKRDYESDLLSFGFEFKLPVGELQSSQKFSKDDQNADDLTDTSPAPDPNVTTDTPDNSGERTEDPVTDLATPATPVPPAALAGAAAATGLLAGLTSWLLMQSMGLGLSDFKYAIARLTGTDSPAPEPPPATEAPPAELRPNDGDVNENGEVWSENSGWVNRELYQQDLATRKLIDTANRGVNAAPDTVAIDLGHKLADVQKTGTYVDLSIQLAERFGTPEEKTWCLDFIRRHTMARPDGEMLDPDTARKMYEGLKKQMVESGQIANEAEADYQNAVAAELGSKKEIVEQIRDNAARVNRVLAYADPTGTGQKILGLQQSVYGTIAGYEEGGIAGAAESAVLAVADNYSQGYASSQYQAVKTAYANDGIAGESFAGSFIKSEFNAANSKYNVLDHIGKTISAGMDGEYGKMLDSAGDAFDAGAALKDGSGTVRGHAIHPDGDTPEPLPVPDEADPRLGAAHDLPKKSLGTLRRESFEETRKSFEDETRVMKQLNEIADMTDPVQRQAELIKVRNADPATFNVVQKQLHPDTETHITGINRQLGDAVVERQAAILESKGFKTEVRLTGKPGGADVDANWTLKDKQTGAVLSEAATRKAATDALKQASDEVLKPLGTDADQMGHKIMNDSPEKFAADPNDLAIKSRDGKLVDGKLVFTEHEQTGDHWPTDDLKKAALTAPKDRIADAAMTRDASKSLGQVFQTKIDPIQQITDQKGVVKEADMRDMAREIVKTNQRTFVPMSEKAGVRPTAEYRDLMQKLMLVKDGEISSKQLPPLREIRRILATGTSTLTQAIDP
jgi:hypothetical protein